MFIRMQRNEDIIGMDTTPAKVNSSNRIGWVDLARSLAIIMVLWNHAVETAFDTSVVAFSKYGTFSRMFLFNSFQFGRLGVPIFLMLTGYLVLSKRYALSFSSSKDHTRSYGQFLRKNYLRLFLCSEIWIVIYFIFLGSYYDAPWDGPRFWNNILMLDQSQMMHVWYIYMILGLYIILPFVSFLLHNMDLRLLILPAFLTVVAYSFLPTLNLIRQINDLQPLYLMIDTSFLGGLYLLFCIMGYLVHKKVFDRIRSIYWWLIGIVSFFLGTALQWVCYDNGFAYLIWYNCFTLLPTGLSLFVLLSRVKIKNGFVSKCLTDLSKLSFGIYLVHIFFVYICLDYIKPDLPHAEVAVIYFVISFVCSYIIVKCLSKIPKLGKILFYM